MQRGGNLLWKKHNQILRMTLPPPSSLAPSRWALGDCRKFWLALDFVFIWSEQPESGWCASLPLQHLFCLLFTSCLFSSSVLRWRLPSSTRPAAFVEVSFIFSNKEAAHLISNELWGAGARDVDQETTCRRCIQHPGHFLCWGWTNRFPKEGWGWMLQRGFWGLWGFRRGGASLKLSFAEQGN